MAMTSVRRGTVGRNVNTCHATAWFLVAVEPYPRPDWGEAQIPGGWAVQLVVQLAFLNVRGRPNHDISSSARPKLPKSASNTHFCYQIPTILAAVDSFIYRNLGLRRYHTLVRRGYQKKLHYGDQMLVENVGSRRLLIRYQIFDSDTIIFLYRLAGSGLIPAGIWALFLKNPAHILDLSLEKLAGQQQREG